MQYRKVMFLSSVFCLFVSTNIFADYFEEKYNGTAGHTTSYALNFSPCGEYLAIGTNNTGGAGGSNDLFIHRWDGTTLTQVAESDTSDSIYTVRWNPRTYDLAAKGAGTDYMFIYHFDPQTETFSLKDSVDLGIVTVLPEGIVWHPEGTFIAAMDRSADLMRIYSWDGTSLVHVYHVNLGTAGPLSVAWSKDGKSIAVGNDSSATEVELRMYGWDESITTSLTLLDQRHIVEGDTEKRVYSLAFHPNNDFLAIGLESGALSGELKIYSWNGSRLSQSPVEEVDHTDYIERVEWCGFGNYLAIGVNSGSQDLTVYRWDGVSTLTERFLVNLTTFKDLSWSRDSQYLAVLNSGSDFLVYKRFWQDAYAQPFVVTENWFAAGKTTFSGGFIVSNGKTLSVNLSTLVGGTLDLNNFGKLKLHGDLRVGSRISGGRIELNSNTIILENDTTIVADTSVHFTPSTTYRYRLQGGIIDGQGHTLKLERWAQLFVDADMTVTLRNLTLQNTRNSQGYPLIAMATQGSKLCLQNVKIKPNCDFYFNEGQLFIHDDVVFTGTHKFVYKSSQPSFIAPLSTWHFEPRTTFYYDTISTYTDGLTQKAHTSIALPHNELVVMQDDSSSFYLNQCTFKISHTGLRLTKGQVFIDNKMIIDNTQTTSFSHLTPVATAAQGGIAYSVSWSPCGRYFAVGGDEEAGNDAVTIYSWSGSSLAAITTADQGNNAYSVAWSPDGRYLAVGGDEEAGNDAVTIYSWDGSGLTAITTADQGSTAFSVAWSPDGRYLAVGGATESTKEVTVYEWNGSSLTQLATEDQGTNAISVSWSPDGKYLAVGGNTESTKGDTEVTVYEWDGSNLAQLATEVQGSSASSVSWSSDGRYLAVGGADEPTKGNTNVAIYEWDGSNLTQLATEVQGNSCYSALWSPDGRYLAVGGVTESTKGDKEVIVYDWDGSSLTSLSIKDQGSYAYSLAWSPDGKYLAVGGPSHNSWEVYVYKVNYDTLTYAPSYDTGFTVGDSANGAVYDVDIFLLSGAVMDIQGTFLYDNS